MGGLCGRGGALETHGEGCGVGEEEGVDYAAEFDGEAEEGGYVVWRLHCCRYFICLVV